MNDPFEHGEHGEHSEAHGDHGAATTKDGKKGGFWKAHKVEIIAAAAGILVTIYLYSKSKSSSTTASGAAAPTDASTPSATGSGGGSGGGTTSGGTSSNGHHQWKTVTDNPVTAGVSTILTQAGVSVPNSWNSAPGSLGNPDTATPAQAVASGVSGVFQGVSVGQNNNQQTAMFNGTLYQWTGGLVGGVPTDNNGVPITSDGTAQGSINYGGLTAIGGPQQAQVAAIQPVQSPSAAAPVGAAAPTGVSAKTATVKNNHNGAGAGNDPRTKPTEIQKITAK